MSQNPNSIELIPPNYELSREIRELSGDRKILLGFAIGGVALLGAGAAGLYSLVSGNHVPVVDGVVPGTGALAGGAAVAGPGLIGAFKTSRKIHRLRRQERQEFAAAREHYQENESLYQEEALRDAAATGVTINGWS